MHQQGGTIKEAVESIATGDYVLPAIQREFIWHPDQVCNLFDSVMQGYPFGEFLIWRINPENVNRFNYYGFVRDYHERTGRHCPELGTLPERTVTAILDGQQRLTAFNIGLRGSMAIKLPRLWWNNPHAFPRRVLALDLLARRDADDDEGNSYTFGFVGQNDIGRRGDRLWFKVSDILQMESGPDMLEWIVQQGLESHQQTGAYRTLDRLYQSVCVEKPIAHYEERSQDIERVLNIFRRCNQGGTPLSYSDMLLSIAVSQWTKLDARREVHGLVDELNGIGAGFGLSKDFVLKAGLMLSDIASVGFRVENFTRSNMEILEQNWGRISTALRTTVHLVSSFGFNGGNIRAVSAMLPIAYYLYIKEASEEFVTRSEHQADRDVIRGWLIRSILKASGIWGSGLDTLLTALREIIRRETSSHFPSDRIRSEMARRGRTLEFTPEEIDDLADMTLGDRRVFALLSLLFPMDFRNNFHIDHVFPASRFTTARLRQAGVSEEQIEGFQYQGHRIANFQLLDGLENNEKRAVLPDAWLRQRFPNPSERQAHCERHLLGEVPEEMADFDQFYQARHEHLKSRIAELVNTA